MKLTRKQQKELDILLWFADYPKVTDDDIKQFFDYSDKGIGNADSVLTQPNEYSSGFVALMSAKRNRDLQITDWKADWGHTVTAWDFIDEPQHIAEWVAEKLDREAVMRFWHENRVNYHRRLAYKYKKITDAKPMNKTMFVSRTHRA